MTMFKASDGVELFYQVTGEGDPIVLIHGWSSDHTGFLPQIEGLSKSYRVISYDLRGHGNSERPEQGLTLQRFAQDLEELMDNLKLQDVTLAGHSMGASTIFEYVKTYGESRLKSIILFDMTPKLINDNNWKLGLYHGKYTLFDSLQDLTTMNENLMDFAEPFFKLNAPYLTDEEMEETIELFKGNTPHVLTAMWHAMTVNDYRDVLTMITVPTLIAYGEKSPLYSKETAEYMHAKILNSKIVAFENCTHLLTVEDPERTTAVIEQMASV